MYDGVFSRSTFTLKYEDGHTFLLRYGRVEMPEPFELNGIEKGIHCVARTGGCFNLDANLFKPEAVDLTSWYFGSPTAERLVLIQTALLWMATAIHGIPFYHILSLYILI